MTNVKSVEYTTAVQESVGGEKLGFKSRRRNYRVCKRSTPTTSWWWRYHAWFSTSSASSPQRDGFPLNRHLRFSTHRGTRRRKQNVAGTLLGGNGESHPNQKVYLHKSRQWSQSGLAWFWARRQKNLPKHTLRHLSWRKPKTTTTHTNAHNAPASFHPSRPPDAPYTFRHVKNAAWLRLQEDTWQTWTWLRRRIKNSIAAGNRSPRKSATAVNFAVFRCRMAI